MVTVIMRGVEMPYDEFLKCGKRDCKDSTSLETSSGCQWMGVLHGSENED